MFSVTKSRALSKAARSSFEKDELLEVHESHIDDGDFARKKTAAWLSPSITFLNLQLVLFALYTLTFFLLWDNLPRQLEHGPSIIYCKDFLPSEIKLCREDANSNARDEAPTIEAVIYEPRLLHNSVNATNIYKGPPNPEQDAAWRELLSRKIPSSDFRSSTEGYE